MEAKAAALIENVLKPRHVEIPARDEQSNHIIDIGSKGYGNSFYFYSTYACPGPNAISPTFESKFARMEYLGNDAFALYFMRYTGEWVGLYDALTVDEYLKAIEDNAWFVPRASGETGTIDQSTTEPSSPATPTIRIGAKATASRISSSGKPSARSSASTGKRSCCRATTCEPPTSIRKAKSPDNEAASDATAPPWLCPQNPTRSFEPSARPRRTRTAANASSALSRNDWAL